ncbi:MAG TPA: phosphoribosylformylglycinamidine synthase subunit PurS [Acidimicrobiales bacterium]|nr:phosphoribosylformylglycinamidine synthase subunit PurS [Acidimicrobiales bacterium]
MGRFDVLVEVSLRAGVADPQGATVERSLPALGFEGVTDVRVGKAVRFHVDAPDRDAAMERVQKLSESFLSNPVIEDVRIELDDGSGR